jgi:hypothetical protein
LRNLAGAEHDGFPSSPDAKFHKGCPLVEAAGLPYEAIPVDTSKGERHTASFRAINPNGKVPTIARRSSPPIIRRPHELSLYAFGDALSAAAKASNAQTTLGSMP